MVPREKAEAIADVPWAGLRVTGDATALAVRVEVERDRSGWLSPALEDGDFALG